MATVMGTVLTTNVMATSPISGYVELATGFNMFGTNKNAFAFDYDAKIASKANGQDVENAGSINLAMEAANNKFAFAPGFLLSAAGGMKYNLNNNISLGIRMSISTQLGSTKARLDNMNISATGTAASDSENAPFLQGQDFAINEDDKKNGQISLVFNNESTVLKTKDGKETAVENKDNKLSGSIAKGAGVNQNIANPIQRAINKGLTNYFADIWGSNDDSKKALLSKDLGTIGGILKEMESEKILHIPTIAAVNMGDALDSANAGILNTRRLYFIGMPVGAANGIATANAPTLANTLLNKNIKDFLVDDTVSDGTNNADHNAYNQTVGGSSHATANAAFALPAIQNLLTASRNLTGRYRADKDGKNLGFEHAIVNANTGSANTSAIIELTLGILKMRSQANKLVNAPSPLEAFKAAVKATPKTGKVAWFHDATGFVDGKVASEEEFIKSYAEKYMPKAKSLLFSLNREFIKDNDISLKGSDGTDVDLSNVPLIDIYKLYKFSEQGRELSDDNLIELGMPRKADDKSKYYIYVDTTGQALIYQGGDADLVNQNITMGRLNVDKFVSHAVEASQTIDIMEIKKRALIKLNIDATVEFRGSNGWMKNFGIELSAGPRYIYNGSTAKIKINNAYNPTATSVGAADMALGTYVAADITKTTYDFSIDAKDMKFVNDNSEVREGQIVTEGQNKEQEIKFRNHAIGAGTGARLYCYLNNNFSVFAGVGFDWAYNFKPNLVEAKEDKEEKTPTTDVIKVKATEGFEAEKKHDLNISFEAGARYSF